MKRRRALALAFSCNLASALFSQPSFGADSAQKSDERAIEIVVVGSADNLKWLVDLVGHDSASGASVTFARIEHFQPADLLRNSQSGPGNVRCWIDLHDRTRARIYFAARAGERFLLRDLELSGSFDELDRESLSQVLAVSWSALFEDEKAGLSREETQALLAKRDHTASGANSSSKASSNPDPELNPNFSSKATRRASSSRQATFLFRSRVQAFYAGLAYAPAIPILHGPGLSLSVGLQSLSMRVAVWVEAQYRFSETERGAQIGVRLESIAARTGLELSWPLGADFDRAEREIELRAGVGADMTHLTPEPGTEDGSAALTATRWSTALALTSSAGASLHLNRGTSLGARLFVDVLPSRVDYDLRVGSATDTLLSPWRVRPGIALEIETR